MDQELFIVWVFLYVLSDVVNCQIGAFVYWEGLELFGRPLLVGWKWQGQKEELERLPFAVCCR